MNNLRRNIPLQAVIGGSVLIAIAVLFFWRVTTITCSRIENLCRVTTTQMLGGPSGTQEIGLIDIQQATVTSSVTRLPGSSSSHCYTLTLVTSSAEVPLTQCESERGEMDQMAASINAFIADPVAPEMSAEAASYRNFRFAALAGGGALMLIGGLASTLLRRKRSTRPKI